MKERPSKTSAAPPRNDARPSQQRPPSTRKSVPARTGPFGYDAEDLDDDGPDLLEDPDEDLRGLADGMRALENGDPEIYELAMGRKRAQDSPDPAAWIKQPRMTQTEVALRLAHYLTESAMVASDVAVALTGHELSRADGPRFPVVRYLAERGWERPESEPGWRGAYKSEAARFALILHAKPQVGDVVATLASGRRFVAHVSGGLVRSTRSPNERNILCRVLGRALTWEDSEPKDVAAVTVPRSKRFRDLALRWRGVERVARAGILILTVDREGTVDGFPRTDLP